MAGLVERIMAYSMKGALVAPLRENLAANLYPSKRLPDRASLVVHHAWRDGEVVRL